MFFLKFRNRFRGLTHWCAWAWLLLASLPGPIVARAQEPEPRVTPLPADAGQDVPYDPVWNGQQSGANRRGNMVIVTPQEWKRVFDITASGLMYKPELPDVDFTQKVVIGILLGDQLAIDRAVKIRRVVKTGQQIVVEYEATLGSTRDANGMTVTKTSQPFFFYSIDKTDLPVVFHNLSPPEVTAAIESSEPLDSYSGDPGGQRTGTIGDVATADRGVVWADRLEMAKGSQAGLYIMNGAIGQNRVAINMVWVLLCAFLIFGMIPGFALFGAGFSRGKNATYAMVQCLCIPMLGALGFWSIGWGLMYGAGGPVPNLGGLAPVSDPSAGVPLGSLGSIFATHGFFLGGEMYDVGIGSMFLLQAAYLCVALAVPTAAVLERMRLWPYLSFGILFSIILYPLFGHWAWGGGWLATLGQPGHMGLGCGYVDYAGAGTVHALGGMAGLAATLALGPRAGRFGADGTTTVLRPHSIPLGLLGGFALVVAGFGLNAAGTFGASGEGSLRIGLVAATTLMAAAGGATVALVYIWLTTRLISPLILINGALAGVVSVSGAVAFVSPSVGFMIGAIGGLLACLAAMFLEMFRIDDPVNAVATHGVGGLWGMLAVGIFADGTYGAGWNRTLVNLQPWPLVGILYGGTMQFVAQCLACVVVIIWGFGGSFALLKVIGLLLKGLRVNEADERGGLDAAILGVDSYALDPSVLGRRTTLPDEVLPTRVAVPARPRE